MGQGTWDAGREPPTVRERDHEVRTSLPILMRNAPPRQNNLIIRPHHPESAQLIQLDDLDAGTLESILGTPPMMADRRAVVLRDTGSLKKDARRVLDQYLSLPAENTVLFLVAANTIVFFATGSRLVGPDAPVLVPDGQPAPQCPVRH